MECHTGAWGAGVPCSPGGDSLAGGDEGGVQGVAGISIFLLPGIPGGVAEPLVPGVCGWGGGGDGPGHGFSWGSRPAAAASFRATGSTVQTRLSSSPPPPPRAAALDTQHSAEFRFCRSTHDRSTFHQPPPPPQAPTPRITHTGPPPHLDTLYTKAEVAGRALGQPTYTAGMGTVKDFPASGITCGGRGSRSLNWGGGVNRAPQNPGGGRSGKRAQWIGPFISYYELWRRRHRKFF